MSNAILPAIPLFADPRAGLLDSGYVWVGVENLDAESNPVAVYWDAALTQPAPQPLRTSAGLIVRNGAPASVHVAVAFSMTVKNARGELVLHLPSGASAVSAAASAAASASSASTNASAAIAARNAAQISQGLAATSATSANTSANAANTSAGIASTAATAAASSASSAASSAATAAGVAAIAPMVATSTYISGGSGGNIMRVDANVYPVSGTSRFLGSGSNRWEAASIEQVYFGSGLASISSGTGSPEGAVAANVGSLWLRTDGGAATTLYVKESGLGNTGWIAK